MSKYIEPHELVISDDVCLQSQTDIKVLGVTIDHRLIFNEHIRVCTLKAARRLNSFSRVSRYLDTKSKNILQFFIMQERSRRILFNDYESDVHHLSDSVGDQTLALRWLKYMLLEVYKCIKKVNTHCLHNLVNSNTILHQVKNSTSKLERFRWFQGIFKYMEWLGYSPSCDTPTLTISNSL